MSSSAFIQFAAAVYARFNILSASELYKVDVERDELFEAYLAAFPEGTNPIFRVRTEHDGNYDRQFIRQVGHLVVIGTSGKYETLWDIPNLPAPYDVVAKALHDIVISRAIVSTWRTAEKQFSRESNVELKEGVTTTFHHFHAKTANYHWSLTPDAVVGSVNTSLGVFRRGMTEITDASIATVQDLIASNAIYRGAEHKEALKAFADLKSRYNDAVNKDDFLWQNIKGKTSTTVNGIAIYRNSVIGSLLIDLSEGVDAEKAVASFEKKVAPENYKRTSSVITPTMIEKAVGDLKALGLENAVERRHAKFSDISVNNVIFVDNSVRGKMKGDKLTEMLMSSARPATVDIKKAQDISIDDFLKNVLPGAGSISLLLENKHLGNFMSLTAPVHENTGKLFKWDNDFAWSYDGDVADSMRQRVQSRGGRVDGVLRFTHQWNDVGRNGSLMDLHVFMPGHEFTRNPDTPVVNDAYGNQKRVGWNRRNDPSTGGVQDVDYTSVAPAGYIPVENITFPNLSKMPEGDYVMKIHNWTLRSPTDSGFKAEIEFAGQVFCYDHPQPLKHKEWVTLAVVTLKNGVFSIRHVHPTSEASSNEKWSVKTGALVPIDTLLASPNHWDSQAIGNKHWFFILKDAKNPDPVRGIYNEFLRSDLEQHRKVFEILGSKTKAPFSDEQMSGLGFSSTRKDEAIVVAANKTYRIKF